MLPNPDPEDEHIRVFLPGEEDLDDLDEIDEESFADAASSGYRFPDAAFASLERGEVHATDLAGFADLARKDLPKIQSRWRALPDDTRETAASLLAELAEESFELDFSRFFVLLLDDSSAIVRQRAISALDAQQALTAKARLIELAKTDLSTDVRIEATLALGTVARTIIEDEPDGEDGEDVREAVFSILSNPAESIMLRRRALEAAAHFPNDARLDPAIEEFFAEEEIGARASAIFAMGQSYRTHWLPTVLGEFAHDDAEVRFEAARAAGALGDVAALQGLERLARDDDAEVRQGAISAIAEIGGKPATRLLEKLQHSAEYDADIEALDEAMFEAQLSVRLEATEDGDDDDEDEDDFF